MSNIEKEVLKFILSEAKKRRKKADGMRSVKKGADTNPKITKMDFLPDKVLNKIAKEKELDEKKKKKSKRPGQPEYYKGTQKSNKLMSKEIKKCAKKPRPKSCYDYWSADKEKDKSRMAEEVELGKIIKEIIELDEKKKKKSSTLSKKTRDSLKKKAKNANMPLGALTKVYKKGLAAWLTGHRQGVPQHAWAMARVKSFIRGGKTRSVDTAEWKLVQAFRKRKKK